MAQLLRARGDTVRVFGRRAYPELARAGIECQQGSITDTVAVTRACTGMDAVVHAAALAGFWGPRRLFWDTNYRGTRTVLGGCVTAGVRRLLYTSSPSVVFGDKPICGDDESLRYPERYLADYPASKAAAEHLLLELNGFPMADGRPLLTCALRPHLIWGPGDPHLIPRLIAAARAGRLRQVGDGSNWVDITYIDHAAAAHVQALDRLVPGSPVCGSAYFIGDAQPVNLWDWIRELLQRVGTPPAGRPIPYRAAYVLGRGLEGVHRLLPFLGEPRMTRFLAAQFAMSHHFSHARAASDFGYNPTVANAEGLRRVVAALARPS